MSPQEFNLSILSSCGPQFLSPVLGIFPLRFGQKAEHTFLASTVVMFLYKELTLSYKGVKNTNFT